MYDMGYHPSEYTDINFRVLRIDRTGFCAPLEGSFQEALIWYFDYLLVPKVDMWYIGKSVISSSLGITHV